MSAQNDAIGAAPKPAFKLGNFCVDEPRPMKVIVIGAGYSGEWDSQLIISQNSTGTAQASLLAFGEHFITHLKYVHLLIRYP